MLFFLAMIQMPDKQKPRWGRQRGFSEFALRAPLPPWSPRELGVVMMVMTGETQHGKPFLLKAADDSSAQRP